MYRVAVFGDPIVRLDLGGERIRLEPERSDELRAEGRPVDLRERDRVRVEIADCAVHLAEHLDALDGGPLTLEPRGDIGELLAHGGRRRGLAVRAREHAGGGMAHRERIERRAERLQGGHEESATRLFQHERVSEIVDVLGGAGEMHPFELRLRGAALLEPAPDPELHRLHVVLGARLDALDGGDVGLLRIRGERLRPARAPPAASVDKARAAGPRASAGNQAHSTRTRSRMSPASLKISRTGASLAA